MPVPLRLAALIKGNARRKSAELRKALREGFNDQQCTTRRLHLEGALEEFAELNAIVKKGLSPIHSALSS
ncbi:hypothetical protein KAF44_20800 (plasmid) [Cupriavidus necator]|nr:hypothetical protein KAF44_20800 [Cupriavidus necator]